MPEYGSVRVGRSVRFRRSGSEQSGRSADTRPTRKPSRSAQPAPYVACAHIASEPGMARWAGRSLGNLFAVVGFDSGHRRRAEADLRPKKGVSGTESGGRRNSGGIGTVSGSVGTGRALLRGLGATNEIPFRWSGTKRVTTVSARFLPFPFFEVPAHRVDDFREVHFRTARA